MSFFPSSVADSGKCANDNFSFHFYWILFLFARNYPCHARSFFDGASRECCRPIRFSAKRFSMCDTHSLRNKHSTKAAQWKFSNGGGEVQNKKTHRFHALVSFLLLHFFFGNCALSFFVCCCCCRMFYFRNLLSTEYRKIESRTNLIPFFGVSIRTRIETHYRGVK